MRLTLLRAPALVAMLPFLFAPLRAQPRQTIRIALVAAAAGDRFGDSAVRGATLGAEEAEKTARLLGIEYDFRIVRDRTQLSNALKDAQLVIDASSDSALSRTLRDSGALVLDLAAPPALLTCAPRVFYLSAPASALSGATMWNSHLEKFGGAQLNERYHRATGAEMDDAAWLGWFASKIALELVMRAHASSPDSLASFARTRRSRFDGQKGRPMSFDSITGAMTQPLYETGAAGEPAQLSTSYANPVCRPRAP